MVLSSSTVSCVGILCLDLCVNFMATSGKTIAKNTIFLYFRMMLIMAVALYTSRVVLDVLGAADYGLYNVVGGVVAMMGFLNGSISAGTSRFITYELGKGDFEKLRNVFNVSLVSHIGIAAIAFFVAETIGLWFVNTQMVFNTDRTVAVNIVYQLSILTTVLQFTQMPYTATIIAHEKMSIYAYISILEVLLKLLMVYVLTIVHRIDALILYAFLLFLVHLLILCSYRVYCLRNYAESKWRFVKDKQKYKEIFSFAGWDIIGGLCVITQGQGTNILLNIYFGPVVNAARAVSYQVQGAFTQFTNNFMTAVNPEIVKSYARKDFESMVKLINNASLYSFYLLLVFMMPAMFKLNVLLNLWLKEVPEKTLTFSLIILGLMMIRAIARPVIIGTHATGEIKSLNLYAGILGLFPLPISWAAFHYGAPSVTAFWIIALWGVFANIAEIVIFKSKLKEFSILEHLTVVYLRCLVIAVLTMVPVYYLSRLFNDDFIGFCGYYIIAFAATCSIVFAFGLTKSLKSQIIEKTKNAIRRIKK